jgi:hypothetical protein
MRLPCPRIPLLTPKTPDSLKNSVVLVLYRCGAALKRQRLEVTNRSQNRKVEYQSWLGRDFTFDRDHATLEDNFGNHYKRINFGIGTELVGHVESESVYLGKSVEDVLVFELPVDSIEYLDLELPAKNFGGEGMLKLRIPRSMIKSKNEPEESESSSSNEATEPEEKEFQMFESAFNAFHERESKAVKGRLFREVEHIGGGRVIVTALYKWRKMDDAYKRSGLDTIFEMWEKDATSGLPLQVSIVDLNRELLMEKKSKGE